METAFTIGIGVGVTMGLTCYAIWIQFWPGTERKKSTKERITELELDARTMRAFLREYEEIHKTKKKAEKDGYKVAYQPGDIDSFLLAGEDICHTNNLCEMRFRYTI